MVSSTSTHFGSVVTLWRYPVKSMMGEELNSSAITDRGLLGDRTYALVDGADGKVATAKNPRKWPTLFEFRAAFIEPPRLGADVPPVRIALPDGSVIRSDQSDVDSTLSAALRRRVTLLGNPRTHETSARAEEYWPDMD